MRAVPVLVVLGMLGVSAVGHADVCGLHLLPPRGAPPPVLSRTDLREMLLDSRSSLPGCIDYDDLERGRITVRVDEEHVVTATARTRPHRDELAEECLAGNARDRVARMLGHYDVRRPVTATLTVERDD